MPAGGSRKPSSAETVRAGEHFLRSEGPSLFRFGIDPVVRASGAGIERDGLEGSDVDPFVPHQANVRIIDAGRKHLGIARERTLITLERFVNTAATTIPVALGQAVGDGILHPGMNVLMTGFGAGLTWGSAVVRWS